MEFLGVGPLELLLIIVIALIVMGPRDMAVAARKVGRFLNQLYKSETWRTVMEASRSLRTLPNRLAREAALEELDEIRDDLKKSGEELQDEVRKAGQRVSTDFGVPDGEQPSTPAAATPGEETPEQAPDPTARQAGGDGQRISMDFGLPEEDPPSPPAAKATGEQAPEQAGEDEEDQGEAG